MGLADSTLRNADLDVCLVAFELTEYSNLSPSIKW